MRMVESTELVTTFLWDLMKISIFMGFHKNPAFCNSVLQ